MGVGRLFAYCGRAVVVVLLPMAALLTSCKVTKYVPVESVRTEYRDRAVTLTDSVFLHDSIFVRETGDTVLVERWHTKYRDRVYADTVRLESTDTIRVPYPVERELSRWERAKQEAGGFALGALGLAALLAIIWGARKML